mmetsp:Transcript_38887/g.58424  ORF Transcript_38887/g.58424 Transcript_38887/m.58424 type:complete len:406 (-) Transcript_38887:26-1243(-)
MAETATSNNTNTEHKSSTQQPPSLSQSLTNAIKLVESSPSDATEALIALQTNVANASIFSTSDTLQDVSTSALTLLSIEHHLGMSYLNASTTSSVTRKKKVLRALELFHYYLRQLEQLGVLEDEKTVLKEYHDILDSEEDNDDNDSSNNHNRKKGIMMTGAQIRESKIQRFRLKKQTNEELQHLQALQDRRNRLGLDDGEDLDGYDDESLQRNLALKVLKCCALESLEEIYSCNKEMEMIDMAIEMEKRREEMERHRGGTGVADGKPSMALPPGMTFPPQNSRSNQPMEVTRVTQDPTTGQLQFKKEQIRSNVFKPSWNQPTMSLAELGDIERAQAIERSERQKVAEADAKFAPRRYDELVRDGMEDNADLVDASAKLDREWDNFKDENPRGSGNKMGDRGDRNF